MRISRALGWAAPYLLTMAALTGTASAGSPTVVSGPSPFADCDVSDEDGTNFPNTEVEPWVDANPFNPLALVAGWQQDRWSNGGARSLLSAYSRNGGLSWKRVIVPGINKCTGGTGDFAYDRSSDPWVAVSPNGTSYFMSLSFFNDREDDGRGANAMLVSRSTDGGASWGQPTVLIRDTDGRVLNDKNSMTADPTNAHFVYATWDRLVMNFLPAQDGAPAPGAADIPATTQHDGVLIAREWYRNSPETAPSSEVPDVQQADTVYYEGPSYFARTADGGRSWEPAQVIHDPGPNAQTINNMAVVRRDGSVFVFFTELGFGRAPTISFVKSTDHGRTFGPRTVAVVPNMTRKGTRTPDLQKLVRDANILFDVAVDPWNGNLYLVWQDGRQGGIERVAFAMSTNGGASWSEPVIIAKTPYNANPYRTQSLVPAVEVGAASTVFVTYYDFRNDVGGSNGPELSDYWAIRCNPFLGNCRTAAGWGREMRLTPKSFDFLNAPYASGYFLGDYQGLVRQGLNIRALFAVTTGPNLTEMVTSLLR